jgi:hypothetical protein
LESGPVVSRAPLPQTELAARFTRRDCSEAMDRLVHAVGEVRIEIAGLLRADW